MESASISNLLVPAFLAAVGYLGKSFYEIYVNKKKRKRELIEKKLSLFYWPVCIRLKKNENVYRYLFEGKKEKEKDSMSYRIAHYVEKNVLIKNHEEIVDIITQYRYLADPGEDFEKYINQYIRHVVIYKALLDADINEFPGVVTRDGPYPAGIDAYFEHKTNALQKELEQINF